MIQASFEVFRSFFRTPDPTRTLEPATFTVMPWHLDLNGHVNNATYLNYCNQARLIHLAGLGLVKPMVQNRIAPVISKTEIQYLRSLKLFDRFTIETQFENHAFESIEISHRFSKKGKAVAIVRSKIKLLSPGGQDESRKLYLRYFGGN
ncbi:MAG: acyl-CoA thioesterase [Bdellovibrionales bacterium]|nr:acyl-CoA thioesterase [Bdellovibrionales bacterium]